MGASLSYPTVDLKNKVAVVTGANTGIGYETAKALASMRAHVIVASRSKERGECAVQKLKEEVKDASVEFMQLDLASLESVREFADQFKSKKLPLHLLINNAGIMALPKRELTKDGFEAQFGTNHLGHFLLTNLLLDVIKDSAPARIVNLSSRGHEMARWNWDDVQSEKSYSPWTVYGNSKLANIWFTTELSRRLEAEGSKVTVNAVHPGVVATELMRNLPYGLAAFGKHVAPLILRTPKDGAATTLTVALDPSLDSVTGKYFADCKQHRSSALAQDAEQAKRLWDLSEILVGLKGDNKGKEKI